MTEDRCIWCQNPMPANAVSDFFCWAGCQELWYRQLNKNPLPDDGAPVEYWRTITINP